MSFFLVTLTIARRISSVTYDQVVRPKVIIVGREVVSHADVVYVSLRRHFRASVLLRQKGCRDACTREYQNLAAFRTSERKGSLEDTWHGTE